MARLAASLVALITLSGASGAPSHHHMIAAISLPLLLPPPLLLLCWQRELSAAVDVRLLPLRRSVLRHMTCTSTLRDATSRRVPAALCC